MPKSLKENINQVKSLKPNEVGFFDNLLSIALKSYVFVRKRWLYATLAEIVV